MSFVVEKTLCVAFAISYFSGEPATDASLPTQSTILITITYNFASIPVPFFK